MTAERLYRFFANEGNQIDLRSLAPLFYHDSHGLWYGEGQDGAAGGARGAARQMPEDREGGELPATEGSESLDDALDASSQGGGGGDRDGEETDDPQDDECRARRADAPTSATSATTRAARRTHRPWTTSSLEAWEDISRRIQIELEAHMLRQGDGAGSFAAALEAVNRESYDYAEFLKRFATLHERMRVNPDEFDYIYYTYGLNRYGNMPLIEPLEYKETRSVHDFAIAIDTSESVSGDLVQAFIRKTYNILKQVENFADRVNIHASSVRRAGSRGHGDHLARGARPVHGRTWSSKGSAAPTSGLVFEYVNLLVEKGAVLLMRGLVYFTDGQGTFPPRKPAYEAVFVFLDDGYSDPAVPPWALKVILDERGLP